MTGRDEIASILRTALESGDPSLIEDAVRAMFLSDPDSSLTKYLVPLLGLPNHHSHEDIVLALQIIRDPAAVDALYDAAHARYGYLSYDEMFGLARKCTWALADIGTPEARSRLEQLANEDNRMVAGYARKRLQEWEDELGRKGPARSPK